MKQIVGFILAEVIIVSLIFFGVFSFSDTLIEYFLSAIEVNGAIVVTLMFFIVLLSASLTRESIILFSFNKIIFSNSERKYFINSSISLAPLIRLIKAKKTVSRDSLDENIEYAFGRGETILTTLPSIMITLGLLGTFIGLSSTISEVAILMASLSDSGDAAKKVELLFAGLPKAIEGMKLAFHTSLYGLGASLVSSVALLVYQHTQDDMKGYLREVVDRFGLLEEGGTSEDNLGAELLKTAQVVNEQTSVFGDAMKMASVSLTEQGKNNQIYLKDLSSHTSNLNESVNSLSTKMTSYADSNDKLDIISEQLSTLNAVSTKGFSAITKSFDSTSKNMRTTLEVLQARHKELSEKQDSQDTVQDLTISHLEKINDHLSTIQETFSKQLLQETLKDKDQYDRFQEDISSVSEQVKIIDLYIKSLEKPNNAPFGKIEMPEKSGGFFGLFRKK